MAIVIENSSLRNVNEYVQYHTISAFDCSGSDSHLVLFSFNKSPTTQVDGSTADGNAMSLELTQASEGANGIQVYDYQINNASFDVVSSTPSWKQQAMVAISLSGVDQTDAIIGSVGENNTGTTATMAYTGTSGNLLLVAVANNNSSNPLTASGCTELQNFDHTTDIYECFVGYITADGTEQTIGATMVSSSGYSVTIIEIDSSSGVEVRRNTIFF